TIHIFIDGDDHTSDFARDATKARGAPSAPLAQGAHTIHATFEDEADNAGEFEASFVVDTEAPSLAITAPDTPFITDAPPPIALRWSDAPPGIRPESLAAQLARVEPPDSQDITSLFAPIPSGVEGTLPDSASLADASYHIEATVRDHAGNVASASAPFQL